MQSKSAINANLASIIGFLGGIFLFSVLGCGEDSGDVLIGALPGKSDSRNFTIQLSDAEKSELFAMFESGETISMNSEIAKEVIQVVASEEPGILRTEIEIRIMEPKLALLRFVGEQPRIDGMTVLARSINGEWRVVRRYIFGIA